jgi:hypothetical protein
MKVTIDGRMMQQTMGPIKDRIVPNEQKEKTDNCPSPTVIVNIVINFGPTDIFQHQQTSNQQTAGEDSKHGVNDIMKKEVRLNLSHRLNTTPAIALSCKAPEPTIQGPRNEKITENSC